MTYRDDDDARLARADALQVDLDRTEAELAKTKAALAKNEAELASAKAALEAAGATKVDEEPAKTVEPARLLALVGIAVVILILLSVWVTAHQAHQRKRADEELARLSDSLKHADLGAGTLRSCIVHTNPEGADVVSVASDGRMTVLGRTPFSRSIGGFRIAGESIEARLEGYMPVAITAPPLDVVNNTCETTITLQRSSASP